MPISYSETGYWVCASFQHLRAFSLQAENIEEFEGTLLSGETAIFLNAIRGRSVVDYGEIQRIAKAQRIGNRRLEQNIIPALQSLGHPRLTVRVERKTGLSVEEHIASTGNLYDIIGRFWETLNPSLVERGAIFVLKHTFVMPRIQAEELSLLVKDGFRDEDAQAILGITTSFRIIQAFQSRGTDESVLFNPYIWRANRDKIAPALMHLPPDERGAVEHSLQTVAKWQAFPAAKLPVERQLLSTAHAIGLLDVVEVRASAGAAQEFVFTPHLTTHPDVSQLADDLLNDVRAVLACVSFGENYSRISRLGGMKREKTINTLRKLLREGEAGDATAIGVDYKLLEERGIIEALPTATAPGGRYKMKLLRPEPVKIALDVVEAAAAPTSGAPHLIHTQNSDPASLFVSPEQTRVAKSPSLGSQPEDIKEAREHYLRKIRREVF